jgi:threonylcarbamoyladenosine tRNA methylthiotransferase CDKAL1
MKRVPTADVKKRSRELTTVFESFDPYAGMEGNVERVWVTDIASDGIHLVSSYSLHFSCIEFSLCNS